MAYWRGLIEEYRSYLPVSDKTPVVSLKEGDTPLLYGSRISEKLGNGLKVYFKFEGLNPTCSFKDRGMTMAISKAVEEGSKAVICASTGNTSASAAAYSARAGLSCAVLLPHGSIALGKLAQSMIYGAKVLAVEGSFDQALALTRELADKYPITMVNSNNRYRIEGQKTAAFEIVDTIGDAPEYHAIPVGNAGNITAYWKGYQEYKQLGKSTRLPRMCGFQAAGAAPIVSGKVVENPHTIATAIKIGNPYSWKSAEAARDGSKGLIEAVTDEEILQAYEMLASLEGIFCEPASAASLAGVIKKNQEGYFTDGEKRIVCTLTGHGLKDPDTAVMRSNKPLVIKPEMGEILKALGF
ncbi:MAG TPA: threonine synthase [bacterium]|nr:threonine synthase [bacterium]